jgi:hypothetical protein
MPDDVRQRLIAYLPRIAGSRSADHEAARLRVMVMAAVRVFAPRALDAAGLHDHAATLRALPDDASYVDVKQAARAAVRAAWAAWAAWAADAADAARAADAERAADAAAETAARAARAREEAWDDYSAVLDAALSAGPQGGP